MELNTSLIAREALKKKIHHCIRSQMGWVWLIEFKVSHTVGQVRKIMGGMDSEYLCPRKCVCLVSGVPQSGFKFGEMRYD